MWAVDIETTCNVPGCPKDSECWNKHKHALDFNRNKITCIGVWSPSYYKVFRGENIVSQFIQDWVEYGSPDIVGHGFKFDVNTLHAHSVYCGSLKEFPIFTRWKHDTHLMALARPEKIPQDYLDWYEEDRQAENTRFPHGFGHRRVRGGYSLKILAPYYLGVPAFWEDPHKPRLG